MARKKNTPTPPSTSATPTQASAEEADGFDIQAGGPPPTPSDELVRVPEPILSDKLVTGQRLIGTLVTILGKNGSLARADAAEQLVEVVMKARRTGTSSGLEITALHDLFVELALEPSLSDKDRVRLVRYAMELEQS